MQISSIRDIHIIDKSHDSVSIKKMYIDIADDLMAGILLGQLIYWFSPDKQGKSRLRVRKDGQLWVAKKRTDWWEEIRLKPREFDRAKKKLVAKDLIAIDYWKFDGLRTMHLRIKEDNLVAEINNQLKEIADEGTQEATSSKDVVTGELQNSKSQQSIEASGSNESVRPLSPEGKTGVTKSVRPLTKHTNRSYKQDNAIQQGGCDVVEVQNYILQKLKRVSLGKEYLIIEDLKHYHATVIKKACDLAVAAQRSRGNYRQGDVKNGVNISSYKFIRCFIEEACEILEQKFKGGVSNGTGSSNTRRGFTKDSQSKSEYGTECFDDPELEKIDLSIDEL